MTQGVTHDLLLSTLFQILFFFHKSGEPIHVNHILLTPYDNPLGDAHATRALQESCRHRLCSSIAIAIAYV